MTEHDDKQVASVDIVANAEPSKGRRRLVKGAIFAVPAIVTLRRASAQIDPQNSIWCTVAQIPKTNSVLNEATGLYEDVPQKDDFGNIIMEDDPQDSCFLSLNNRGLN